MITEAGAKSLGDNVQMLESATHGVCEGSSGHRAHNLLACDQFDVQRKGKGMQRRWSGDGPLTLR